MNTDHNDHDVLRELLVKDSRRELPEFSPLLHARIMRNIQECDRTAAQRQWRISPGWYGLAAAAVLAIGVSLWMFLPSNAVKSTSTALITPSPSAQPTDADPDVSIAIATAAQSDLAQARYAGLDDDAQNLVNYAMDQVDPLSNNP
jgi:hypothetical protein